MTLEIHPIYRGNLKCEVDYFLRVDGTKSIPERLRDTVSRDPEGIALRSPEGDVRLAEFDRLTNIVGRRLLEISSGDQKTVGLLFGHTPWSLIGMYGTLRAGMIGVPMDRDYPVSNLEYMVKDSRMRTILTDTQNLALAETLKPDGAQVIDIQAVKDEASGESVEVEIDAWAPAAIYYTSGSTGQPKGILKLHNALHHRAYGFGPGDRQAHLTSFAVTASISGVYGALLAGTTLDFYAVKELGISGLAEWLRHEHIQVFYPPVSLFHQFVDTLKDGDHFPDMKLVQLAGQRVNVQAVETFRRHLPADCLIKHLLASSESGSALAIFITPDVELHDGNLPVGYPTIEKKVRIIDEEGRDLGTGKVGEIVVQGRYVAAGYWGEAARNQEKIIQTSDGSGERIVFTGDIGLLREDGMLEFHGRKDEMVKISGYRVELPIVEAALLKIPGIKEAAVTANETSTGNKRLIAYISPLQGQKNGVIAIRKSLGNELPWYMLPSQIIFLEKLPRTPNGKLDRAALPEPSHRNIARDKPYVAARNSLESQLVKIWEKVIGVRPIGVQDDFFSIGGDSLQAMRIFVEIERLLGKKLPLSLLLKAVTVAQQAEVLQKKNWTADWSTLVEVQPNGSKPPLFCLPGAGGNVLNFHDLSRYLGEDQPCYALQSKGIGGQEDPLTEIADIARHHIQAIREIQPHGPYYVCGSSFGGKAAYEIAQQLHDQGERVALVAMFDTYGPDYPKRIPGMKRGKVRVRRMVQKLNKHLKNLGKLDWRQKVDYLQMRLPRSYRRFQVWMTNKYQEIRYPLPDDLKRVRKANKQANRYMPDPPRFDGRWVLFRANHRAIGLIYDPLLGWGAVDTGKIETIEVEGHHDTLLWEPQVGEVARILGQILSELQ